MDQRYSAVPWLSEADLVPMGAPETSIEAPGDLTLGLVIPHPFGPGDAMLAIHAQETPNDPGGIISLAITALVEREVPPAMDMTLLSGPRRHIEKGDE